MEKIKYGILGCGKHALDSHALPGKNISGLELTIICDTSQKSLDDFEKAYGERLTKTTKREEFFSSDIDAVLIGTPDEFHYTDLVDSIASGKHVFVEKPLATNPRELQGLRDLLSQADERGLIISSCHPRRLDPPFLWLSSRIQEFKKRFGKVLTFGFDFSYHHPSKSWKHQRGLLLDHANHEVDLMHYFFGISKFKATRLSDAHDQYKIVGKREDGIDFFFSGTRRLHSRVYAERSFIRFERGELTLDSDKGKARVYDHEKELEEEIEVPKTDYSLRGRRTMEDFVNSIKESKKPYLSPEDLFVNTATSVILSQDEEWEYNG